MAFLKVVMFIQFFSSRECQKTTFYHKFQSIADSVMAKR